MADGPVCKGCVAEFGSNKGRNLWRDSKLCHTHFYRKKREQAKRRHDKRVQVVYGLEPGEYDELYQFQHGRCAICFRATGRTRRLSVDHDHKTGHVRGLLCRPCNDLLGHLRDDLLAAMRIVRYLRETPYDHMRRTRDQ